MRRIIVAGVLLCLFFCGFTASAQRKIDATTEFTINGAVEQVVKVNVQAIMGYAQQSLGDVVVKNHKGEEKKVAKNVKGVLVKTILEPVKIRVDKPKEYSQLAVILTASDGYKNVYSWNELMNNPLGDHVYIITEQDNKDIAHMESAIIVVSTSDINAGSRYFKGLKNIEIRKLD